MQISREVAITEVMLNEQARYYSESLPRVSRRMPIAAILSLLAVTLWLFAGVARADSLMPSLTVVGSYLQEYSVLPITQQADMQLARNILLAQSSSTCTYCGPESLLLSEQSVLGAIQLYAWAGVPISSQTLQPLVWLQASIAINPNATVTVWPSSITFADTPVSTPEPWTWMLALAALLAWCLAKVLGVALGRGERF